jgi:hypothetical protein
MAEGLTYIKAQASSGDACYHVIAGRKTSVDLFRGSGIWNFGLWERNAQTPQSRVHLPIRVAGWSSGSSSGS